MPGHEPDHIAGLAPALFHATGVDGVYGRTALYETLVEALGALISRRRPAGAEVLRFPPVMSRRHLERQGYVRAFPHLLGCVSCLGGAEDELRRAADRCQAGEPWSDALEVTDLVLTPAACYPLYSILAARGPAPRGGLVFDVASDCFRREPSRDIDRLQSFRQREFVCVGSPARVEAFRDDWMAQAQDLAVELGLPYRLARASDPFFGGGVMGRIQKARELKFELLAPIRSEDQPTACISFNNHRDQMAAAWDLTTADGEVAHSACVGFGMDRLAIALFATHGADPDAWPPGVRTALEL